MGRPMAHNLLKAGFTLVVWNRTASRADSLVAAGARLVASPKEAAAAADVLITIVSDPPALEEVLWGSGSNGDGQSAGNGRIEEANTRCARYRRHLGRPLPAALGARKKANSSS